MRIDWEAVGEITGANWWWTRFAVGRVVESRDGAGAVGRGRVDGGEYAGIGVGHEAAETDVIQYVLGPAPGVDGVVVDRSAWYVLLSEHGRNGVVAVAGAGEEEKYVYVTRGDVSDGRHG